jgi:hypothetical protein
MKTSPETDKIYPAFLKMQRELGKAKKSADNPFFKSKYADLSSVQAACEDALALNGFFFTQGYGLEPVAHLYTRLVHSESGQWLESQVPLIVSKEDPQGVGSATTYFRRYSIVSMLNLEQEDDDGNRASMQNSSPSKPHEKTKGGPDAKKVSVAALNEIKAYLDSGLVNDTWWQEKKKLCKVAKAQDLDEKQALELLAELKEIERKENGKA